MGGNAAKERRRLKRLEQAQNAGEKSNAAPTAVSHDTREPNAITIEQNVSSKSSGENKLKPTKDTNVKRVAGNIADNVKPTLNSTQTTSISKTSPNNGKRKHSKMKEGHGSNRSSSSPKIQSNTQKQVLPRAKKYKKPKHLARKIANNCDPEALKKFEKLKEELVKVKAKRVDKFELKVVKMVGGKHMFNKEAFDSCINGGGTNLETIVNAAKINGIAGKHTVIPGNEKKRKGCLLLKTTSSDIDCNQKTGNIAVSVVDELDVDTNGKSERRETKVRVNNKTENIALSVVDEQCIDTNGESERREAKVKAVKSSCASEQGKIVQVVSSSSPKNSDERDDLEENLLLPTTRTRGRRRRGRVDADIKRDILNTQQEQNAIAEKNVASTQPDAPKKKPMRCFDVGKTYTGTVVYVKPQLGVFIDIGCHSDAFCHISRISDSFVDTITDAIFKTGDILESKVRITDINRKDKKITVSLQSEDRIADEAASARSLKERREKRYQDKNRKKISTSSSTYNSIQNNSLAHAGNNEIEPVTKELTDEIPVSPKNRAAENDDTKSYAAVDFNELDMSNMTPAEYKRARKLQRRAERRKQKELEDPCS